MKKILHLIAILATTLLATPTQAQSALQFNGTNQYVTMGAAPGLNSLSFTLECWIKKEAGGATTTSGTGGVTVIPIIAKGRGESDYSNVDCNYIFGVTTTGVLTADFEDKINVTPNPNNHPVIGVTAVPNDVWCHVAVTYDGTTWNLYLNGVLDATKVETNGTPQNLSIQHSSIASALTSTGAAAGFFKGTIDDVRIWNYARSATEIAAGATQEIATATGLIGVYNLNEGTGLVAANTGTAVNVNGALTPTATPPTWVTGAVRRFPNRNPSVVVNGVGAVNCVNVNTINPRLTATPTDLDNNNTTVRFFAREKAPARPNFTIMPISDMQFYHGTLNGGTSATAQSQATWMVNNMVTRNIKYAIQLGDCVQLGDNNGNDIEWRKADTTFKIIENPATTGLPHGLPYGICVGNHDQGPTGSGGASLSTTFYNQYFGTQRFLGRPYYGGNFGTNNDNHFQLFSASGMDFISISLEYDPIQSLAVTNWADSLLKAYPNRRGIVSSHWIINADASFSAQGQIIYDQLKDNPNLTLMLCGHVTEEARRTDTVAGGGIVYTLLSDYQARTNGGDGWFRIMEFRPDSNMIDVKTYSTTLQRFETDANSQFTLYYDMNPNRFIPIDSVLNVPSGTAASINWNNRVNGKTYEWYATAQDQNSAQIRSAQDLCFTVNINTAINEVSVSGLKLFPNPIESGILNLSDKRTGNISDISGRILLTFKEMQSFSVAMLPKGVYVLTTMANESIKFVVE
jgi:hypothetical protein